MAGLRRFLDPLMGNMRFCALQTANEQRRFSGKRAEREGYLRQDCILIVTEDEGGFSLFIHKRISTQANGKVLFIFTG